MAARLGIEPGAAVPWAAACELLHNATLVHDDLQDGDEVRRGQPTAWVRHGVAQAINAGDLMWIAPIAAVDHSQVELTLKWLLAKTIGRYGLEVVRGQATEWSMSASFDATWDTYLMSIRGKTSALFRLPVVGSALLAGLSEEQAEVLAGVFAEVGLVFQMQDDVLDLFGSKGRAELGADLYEGKLSALVVAHIEISPDSRESLRDFLAKPRAETDSGEVDTWIETFRTGGALEAVCQRIMTLSHAVAADPILETYPEVMTLQSELMALVLEPISHVMESFGLSR